MPGWRNEESSIVRRAGMELRLSHRSDGRSVRRIHQLVLLSGETDDFVVEQKLADEGSSGSGMCRCLLC